MNNQLNEFEKGKLLEALKRESKLLEDGRIATLLRFDFLVSSARLQFDKELRKKQLLELHDERKIKILDVFQSKCAGDALNPHPWLAIQVGFWGWQEFKRFSDDSSEQQQRILTNSIAYTKRIYWFDEKPWKGGNTAIAKKWEEFDKGFQKQKQEALDAFYRYRP
jgi:hypothetical protein